MFKPTTKNGFGAVSIPSLILFKQAFFDVFHYFYWKNVGARKFKKTESN